MATAVAEVSKGVEGSPASRVDVVEGATLRTEGRASILQHGNDVFYNPAQVINRDLSIAVLNYFCAERAKELASGKLKRPLARPQPSAAESVSPAEEAPGCSGIRVLEGLAATGLRSIRYALEVEGVGRVDANDVDPEAAAAIRRNVELNGGAAAAKVRVTQGDVRLLMLQNAGGYEAVDLDPYGTPAQFLDGAVQAVSHGGLLLVTATDMAVLCGNNGEACFAKYGSYPLHRPYCHEMALRILLHALQTHAARYKRHIIPVVSLSIDFYVRLFVRVFVSAEATKEAATRSAYVWQSQGCDSFFFQRIGRKQVKGRSVKFVPGIGPGVPLTCPETGAGWLMGGPIWLEPLHDTAALQGLLAHVEATPGAYPAHAKLRGLLVAAAEELADAPLYWSLHDLCRTVRVTPPPADTLRSAIVHAGYRVSSTHANPLGIKTDAPPHVVWDIMRCWVQQHGRGKPPDPESYAGKLLAREPELKADFSRAPGAGSAAKAARVARFVHNEANWGPRPKHGRTLKEGTTGSSAEVLGSHLAPGAAADAQEGGDSDPCPRQP